MIARVREERGSHQQGRERDLHPGQRPPDDRAHPRERDRRDERDVVSRPPGERRPTRDERRRHGRDDADHLWPSRARARRRTRPRRAEASTAARSSRRSECRGCRRIRRRRRGYARSADGSTNRRAETRNAPAICHSRATKSASGSRAAATTRPSARHRARAASDSLRPGTRDAGGAAWRLRADEGVVLVVDGLPAERQHVEIAAVRDLDLDRGLRAAPSSGSSGRRTRRAARRTKAGRSRPRESSTSSPTAARPGSRAPGRRPGARTPRIPAGRTSRAGTTDTSASSPAR